MAKAMPRLTKRVITIEMLVFAVVRVMSTALGNVQRWGAALRSVPS